MFLPLLSASVHQSLGTTILHAMLGGSGSNLSLICVDVPPEYTGSPCCLAYSSNCTAPSSFTLVTQQTNIQTLCTDKLHTDLSDYTELRTESESIREALSGFGCEPLLSQPHPPGIISDFYNRPSEIRCDQSSTENQVTSERQSLHPGDLCGCT